MEIWKEIKEYEGIYEASNTGLIRSIDRESKHNIAITTFVRKGKLLNSTPKKSGYLRVFLSKNNKVKTFYVHRLVAECFLEKTNNKNQVNHLNGIKSDNRIENLEWCTKTENIKHGFDTGLLNCGEKSIFSKLNEEKVLQIVDLRKKGYKLIELSEKFDVTKMTIMRILNGTNWARTTKIKKRRNDEN